jgi:hypothetical protein
MIKLLPILNEIGGITGPVRYDANIAGQDWSVKFDVNKNPTKIGIKMQFYPQGGELTPDQINEYGNEIASYLQKQFAPTGIIIERDRDMPDKFSGVGFIIPLDSLSLYIMTELLGQQQSNDDPQDNGDFDMPKEKRKIDASR